MLVCSSETRDRRYLVTMFKIICAVHCKANKNIGLNSVKKSRLFVDSSIGCLVHSIYFLAAWMEKLINLHTAERRQILEKNKQVTKEYTSKLRLCMFII